MHSPTHNLPPSIEPEAQRRTALRAQFVITSLPVGGAETLLSNLVRRLDPSAVRPEVCCLKHRGQLAAEIAEQIPVHDNFLGHKWDLRVLPRLTKHFRRRKADAVITIGAGDKMFWGRLAARMANVPVICSALHSTGWPDEVGRLNRQLTSITTGFIACAEKHAQYLVNQERLPAEQVFVIPNGVDTDRFRPNHSLREWLRSELNLAASVPLVGVVAALRQEKNLGQFVTAAKEIVLHQPEANFIIVGAGPERSKIETAIRESGLGTKFHLLGYRGDTEKILAGLDVFCLTSRNEANPVSILEALACGIPVVGPDVGSISETVLPQQTGLLTKPLCAASTADAVTQLLGDPSHSQEMGLAGRQLVRKAWSLDVMVSGYEKLIANLYNAHAIQTGNPPWQRPQSPLSHESTAAVPLIDQSRMPAETVSHVC